MRTGLEVIEKIERFLEGKMSGDEAATFEKHMQQDPALRQQVEAQQSMIGRVNQAGKKASMKAAHAAHISKMKTVKWVKTGVVAVGVTGAAIVGGKTVSEWNEDMSDKVEEVNVQHKEEMEAYEESRMAQYMEKKQPKESTMNEDIAKIEKTSIEQEKEEVEVVQKEDVQTENDTEKKVEVGTVAVKKKLNKVQQDSLVSAEPFRKKGTRMYITTNDMNARTHFIREIEKYDTWKVATSKENADFQIRLFEEKDLLDRLVWIEIVDIATDKVLYQSPHIRGLEGNIRTVNIKQQAVYNLVHRELNPEFFR